MGEVLAMTMRSFALMAVALLLSACSGAAPDGVALGRGPLDGGVGRIAQRLFSGGQPTAPSAPFQALLATPAPAIVVSVENRAAVTGFLRQTIRTQGNATIETWISPDNVALYLQQGFVVGTRGLGLDMMSADVSQSAALVLSRRSGQVQRFMSFLDGNDQVAVRSYVCDIESRGARQLDLGTGMVTTELMQERCTNPDQTFQNLYWIEASTGQIAQSRQWAGDFSGPLAIRRAQR
jgi:Group 4 capsule polysaccharide lipoprotein gfcB, YjbF